MNTDTETKKLMDRLAAELAKDERRRNKKLVAVLNKKLDQALGTELKDERFNADDLPEFNQRWYEQS
jgi:hypothetical protein